MAYPTVDKPYGYKPINVIGGQAYAGSTRNLPIQYNYGTAIYYGDFVVFNAGYIERISYPLNSTNTTVGVFLGCYYTNPTTKQRQFAQYYPGNVTAGDITAIVADDPDLILQVAVATTASSGVVGSASSLLVGGNVVGTTTLGSASTGNGTGGVVAASAVNTATSPYAGFRVIGLVPDTQVSSTGTYVSGTGTTTLGISGLTVGQVIPLGTDIFNLVNGQLQFTGSTTAASTTVTSTGTTSIQVVASTATVAGTVALVQTPEVFVKINFGSHRYNVA
jgi:hypothetical protein